MASHCEEVATNDNAKKVVKACEDNFEANKADCNKFLKAVATALGVAGIPGGDNANADAIINALEAVPAGWTKLAQGSHQEAHDQAVAGKFVVSGLLSTDMNKPNGHVAVVTCGDMVHSGADDLDYPRGYWGTLGTEGKQCTGMNFGYPAPARKELRYYWISMT